jgi:hypothetical protein
MARGVGGAQCERCVVFFSLVPQKPKASKTVAEEPVAAPPVAEEPVAAPPVLEEPVGDSPIAGGGEGCPARAGPFAEDFNPEDHYEVRVCFCVRLCCVPGRFLWCSTYVVCCVLCVMCCVFQNLHRLLCDLKELIRGRKKKGNRNVWVPMVASLIQQVLDEMRKCGADRPELFSYNYLRIGCKNLERGSKMSPDAWDAVIAVAEEELQAGLTTDFTWEI